VIARLAGAVEFGQYALTLTVWLIIAGIHRALITEPVIVTSGAIEDRRGVIAHGLGAELLLGAAVSVVAAVAGIVFLAAGAGAGALMLALAPWLTALLIQDYWRAMSFQERRPERALINDVVFAVVQGVAIVAFLLLGFRSAPWIVTAWGIGGLAGALLGLRWHPAIGGPGEGWQLLRRFWSMSRWFLADFSTGFASDQSYVALAALLMSQADYGGFRAAYSLLGPSFVIAIAAGNIGLPEASRCVGIGDIGALREVARRLNIATFAALALYGGFVAVAGRQLLTLVYGQEFARFAHVAALVAGGYSLLGLVFGCGVALKASGKIRRLWRARVVVAALSLTSMVVLIRGFGVMGAGWAGGVTGIYFIVAVYVVYRAELGHRTEKPVPEPLRVA
jgi:O-antigen/teichoic acid export membrane protein